LQVLAYNLKRAIKILGVNADINLTHFPAWSPK
jgi:hypothetical protein